jgi:ribosome-associated protein
MAGIRITRNVSIPDAEIEVRASRSGGPGGQSVNTSDSKVELRWDLAGSAALTEAQRARLLQRLRSRLTNDGVLILQGAEHKSQHRNREAVVARLKAIVGEAIEPPKPRRRTRPSRASKERRLKKKKERGEIKRLRKPPPT